MVIGESSRGLGLLPPSVADYTAFYPKAGSGVGENGLSNISREASGSKIT